MADQMRSNIDKQDAKKLKKQSHLGIEQEEEPGEDYG